MRLSVSAASLAGTVSILALLAAGPARAEDGEISSVLLSSGGLAEIVRGFEADGSVGIRMAVPTAQVDDILKSIVVSDPAGTVTGVSLEGLDSLAETFRTLPVRPDDLVSTERLAAAMRGFEAVVDDGEGRSVRGTILGVSSVQRPSPGEPVAVPAVSLQSADGIVRQVLLGPAATISFPDPAVAARIVEAGRALKAGRDSETRTVLVRTEGQGRRPVSISYVAAAPVWKVSYRVIAGPDGKARIQGWAILENATGEDWSGVTVTLSSSNPMALKQRLYDLYWRPRTEIPIALPGGPATPMVDDGALSRRQEEMADLAPEAGTELASVMAGLQRTAPAAPPAMAAEGFEPSRPTLAATVVEGDVGIRFTLPEPVDLPAGQTLSVPIIDADYEAELVSLFDPSAGSEHPVAALFVDNGTGASVPPGIFTVFGAEGYLGDAQILGIPPGEKRFAAYAADPKTTVETETRDRRAIAALKISRGVLEVSRRNERVTIYAVDAPEDAARTVMIDHPRQVGWTMRTEAEIESETGGEARLRTRLPAGGTATVRVTEEIVTEEGVALIDSDADALAAWAGVDGIDEATKARLLDLAALRREVAEAEDAAARAREAVDRFAEEQGRIRSNLAAVPATSELGERYLAALADTEARIGEARDRLEAALAAGESARDAYRDAVERF